MHNIYIITQKEVVYSIQREIPAALDLASMEIVPSLDQTHTPATVKELVTKENDVSEEFYPYLHYHF